MHRRVTLTALKARPELNGAQGMVVGYAERSGRFAVQLTAEPHHEQYHVSVRGENLELRD